MPTYFGKIAQKKLGELNAVLDHRNVDTPVTCKTKDVLDTLLPQGIGHMMHHIHCKNMWGFKKYCQQTSEMMAGKMDIDKVPMNTQKVVEK